MKHPETAFITGIGGFIGARLAQRCASEDGPLRGEGNEAFGEAFNITDGRARSAAPCRMTPAPTPCVT